MDQTMPTLIKTAGKPTYKAAGPDGKKQASDSTNFSKVLSSKADQSDEAQGSKPPTQQGPVETKKPCKTDPTDAPVSTEGQLQPEQTAIEADNTEAANSWVTVAALAVPAPTEAKVELDSKLIAVKLASPAVVAPAAIAVTATASQTLSNTKDSTTPLPLVKEALTDLVLPTTSIKPDLTADQKSGLASPVNTNLLGLTKVPPAVIGQTEANPLASSTTQQAELTESLPNLTVSQLFVDISQTSQQPTIDKPILVTALNQAGKEFLHGGVIPQPAIKLVLKSAQADSSLNQATEQAHVAATGVSTSNSMAAAVSVNSKLDQGLTATKAPDMVNQIPPPVEQFFQLSTAASNGGMPFQSAFSQEFSQSKLADSPVAPTITTDQTQTNLFASLMTTRDGVSSLETKSSASVNSELSQPKAEQIIAQIVDQAKIVLRQQTTEMVIHLKPEHLGEMTLKVSVDQGVVQAAFHTNNSDVRQVLESSMLQLKSELQQAGLKVEHVGVYAGMNQFMSQQQQPQPQQQPQHTLPQQKHLREDDLEDSFVSTSAQLGLTEGVDYRI